jgi:membrane protein DedA with SNARE-associated domain
MLEQLTHQLIEYLNAISRVIPLPVFTFLGSIIEEIIAPIPSPLVMTLSGSLAASQQQSWIFLAVIALTGAIGKTLASALMYVAADKAEDVVLNKFGKFIGVSHRQIESIGKHLNKGWRDDVVLFFLRAIPIVPTAPVSVICGLIKINLRTFLTSTLLGTFVRNMMYLAVGYTGINATEALIVEFESVEIVLYIALAVIVLAVVGYWLSHRHKEKMLHRIINKKSAIEHSTDSPTSVQ